MDCDIRLYPNPTGDLLNIAFSRHENDLSLILTDILGNELQTMLIKANQDYNVFSMDVSGLGKGIYLLNIIGKNNKQALRVMKY